MEKVIQPASEGSSLPATYKRTEILEPEALLRRYIDGSYEDQLELRGMMKLRAAMLLVMDLINLRKGDAEAFALEVKPIIDLMKETRAEQDAAAERARGASMDIAKESGLAAAEEVAGRVAAYFNQKKPDIASTPDPMKGFMARAMETMWDRITGTVLGGAQTGQAQLPPGWADKRQQGG
jgi:hypothetical protein